MSSISTVTAVPYLPAVSPADDAGPDVQPLALETASTRAADPRPVSLAPETTAALLAEQAESRANLSGRDLRGTDLTALNLKGADLRGADLTGMDLTGLDLTGANLSDAKLAGALLSGTNLTDVSAQRANFEGASLKNTALSGGDFSGADFTGAYLSAIGKDDSLVGAQWMSVKGARFDGARFQNAHLRNLAMHEVTADAADFSGAKMDSVYTFDVSLRDANFDQLGGTSISLNDSDVSGAAMTNMRVRSKVYTNTVLEGTRFAGSSFNHTGFTLTDLTTADLSGVVRQAQFAGFGLTNMSNLDFSGFDFFGAHFNDLPAGGGVTQRVATAGASYAGTDFSGADFDHASFYRQGDLRGADFSGASFNQTMVYNLAGSALGSFAGVRESQGDAISRAESQAVRDMSAGKRPIQRGFSMPDDLDYIASGGKGFGLNDQDPADRAKIARIWAENGWTGLVMDPLIQPQAAKSPGGSEPDVAASDNTSTASDARSALETLKSVNESMRAAAKRERDRVQDVTDLFRVIGSDTDKG